MKVYDFERWFFRAQINRRVGHLRFKIGEKVGWYEDSLPFLIEDHVLNSNDTVMYAIAHESDLRRRPYWVSEASLLKVSVDE